MDDPRVVSRDEWLAARRQLLAQEKELTRRRDALNTARRELPMPPHRRTRPQLRLVRNPRRLTVHVVQACLIWR
jgi:hypothetical protein